MKQLKAGSWLGIDVGSARKKVCSFCLIESDGAGNVEVWFEKGSARAPYPEKNSRKDLIDQATVRPPFKKAPITAAVESVLDESVLVSRWLSSGTLAHSAVAVDAPAGFALGGKDLRLTEERSSQTFKTPDEETFRQLIAEKKDPYLNVNVFWKCVGLAVYRHLAKHTTLAGDGGFKSLAALTCEPARGQRRIRETFPSDVYKRANGRVGTLSGKARSVLKALVPMANAWRPAESTQRPTGATMKSLREIGYFLHLDLQAGAERLCEMRKRNGTCGDLWDAFTCAYVASCEDHGGSALHGEGVDDARLRLDGSSTPDSVRRPGP